MPSLDPNSIAIRPATAADAEPLATLRYHFRRELGAPIEAEAVFVERAAAWLRDRLALAAWRAWVAVDADDRIVGHVFVQTIEKIPNPIAEGEYLAYLTNAYVLPEWRNHGVGTWLLQAALQFCDAAQIEMVILWPSPDSSALYRRLGFAPPQALLERPKQRGQPPVGGTDNQGSHEQLGA
jgi:GNAT superfamily N-acetyltransferase